MANTSRASCLTIDPAAGGIAPYLRSLRILEESLAALSQQPASANPGLLEATAPAYVQRITALQSKIVEHLYAHLSDVSRLAAALPAEALAA